MNICAYCVWTKVKLKKSKKLLDFQFLNYQIRLNDYSAAGVPVLDAFVLDFSFSFGFCFGIFFELFLIKQFQFVLKSNEEKTNKFKNYKCTRQSTIEPYLASAPF